MTDFLLILNKLSNFSKIDIDQGKTPLDVYRICGCIRNIFCLSYSIRKSNTFYIYLLNSKLILKFDGNRLRYLGPDERSQSLLLNKALNLSVQREWKDEDIWVKSTPGIFIKKLLANQDLADFCHSLSKDRVFFFSVIDSSTPDFLNHKQRILKNIEQSLLIFTSNIEHNQIVNLSDELSKSENFLIFNLPSITAVEDKILYINFQIDRFREKSNDTEKR